MHRSPDSLVAAASIGALLAVTGCATTPPSSSYALAPGGIGVSVISQSPTTIPVDVSSTGKVPTERTRVSLSGWGYFGPGALLLAPFALAYAAVSDAARGAAQSAQCDAKLKAAYPDASTRFHDVLQREFMLQDLQQGFVGAVQKHSDAEVIALSSPVDSLDVPSAQQVLNTAAHRRLAYLLFVEVLSADLAPLDVDCDQWAFRVSLRVSLWSIADGKRVAGPLFTYPYVNARLAALRTMMEETGALRARLAPNFELAADDIIDQRRFVLPH